MIFSNSNQHTVHGSTNFPYIRALPHVLDDYVLRLTSTTLATVKENEITVLCRYQMGRIVSPVTSRRSRCKRCLRRFPQSWGTVQNMYLLNPIPEETETTHSPRNNNTMIGEELCSFFCFLALSEVSKISLFFCFFSIFFLQLSSDLEKPEKPPHYIKSSKNKKITTRIKRTRNRT